MILYLRVTQIIFTIILPLSLFAQDLTNLEKMEWILGKWAEKSEKSTVRENWIKLSEKTFESSGITISNTDQSVVNTESLRLVLMEGEIFYIAKVGHNQMLVAFKLSVLTDSLAVFENQDHDFPKKIQYKMLDKNKIEVFVGAAEKGFKILFQREDDD